MLVSEKSASAGVGQYLWDKETVKTIIKEDSNVKCWLTSLHQKQTE